MKYDELFGISLEEQGWVPAPRYLLRRDRVLRLLRRKKPKNLLEIGCGVGALLYDLNLLGISCTALEGSHNALSKAASVNTKKVDFYRAPLNDWKSKYDCVCAFEVLEHIEDDFSALKEWVSWLDENGILVLSVPAHENKWSATDDWAGHVRRYEKSGLIDLMTRVGLSVEHFECYGFPLANFLDPIRSRMHSRALKRRLASGLTGRATHNELSGVERGAEARMYPLLKSFIGKAVMRCAYWLQSMTSSKDWGNGYLLVAKKVGGNVPQ